MLFASASLAANADGTRTWLGTWRPILIEGREIGGDAGRPEITFAGDGTFTGSLGCNRVRGRWSGDATGLTFSQVASTRMACLGAAMATESRFAALLAKTWRLEGGGRGLTVWTSGGQSRFVRAQ